MSAYIISYSETFPTFFKSKKVSQLKNTSFTAGFVKADVNSPFMPKRSDLKIMREDIAVSIIDIKKMLSELNLSENELEKTGLFIANGSFLDQPEKHLDRIPEIFKFFTADMSDEDKKKLIYQKTPPLLALETLTNSSMSFIAQYTKIKGHNTTFGNTSISGTFGVKQSVVEVENNLSNMVLCGGANCGDTYSFLCNSPLFENIENWKESAAVGNLLIKTNLSNNETPLAKISQVKINSKIPNLSNQKTERMWRQILPKHPADLVIFSGAFTDKDYELDKQYLNSCTNQTFSFFNEYGNLGAANIVLGIIKGIKQLSYQTKIIDIIDRDVYGRESLVRIEKC